MTDAIVKSESVGQLAAQDNRPTWTRERIDLVKATICPAGISDTAFALFMEQCKRSGLDPLLKEAFCVPRRQKVGHDKWAEKHEFQPSEAGMLARAERFPDFKGIQASAVYAEDEILVDQGEGTVTHRFNPAKRKGALVGAWSRVVRSGKLPVVVWLDFAGYVQQTPLWSKIPTTMIEKCARVAALRKAYPEAFGGLYIREEMPPDDEEKPTEAKPRKALPLPPEDPPTPEESAAIDGQFRAAAASVGALLPVPEEDTHVITGVHRGKAITLLDEASLESAISAVSVIVNDPANRRKKSYEKASRSYAALTAERDSRKAVNKTGIPLESLFEPGSEG